MRKKIFLCLVISVFLLGLAGPGYADIYLSVKNGEISLTNTPKDESYVLVYSSAGEEGEQFEGPADLQKTINRASNKHRLPESLIFAIMSAVENVEGEGNNIMALPESVRNEMNDTEARDKWVNLDRGAARLREMIGYFDGNLTLALGAYFGSIERVEEVGGIPSDPHVQRLVDRARKNFDEYRSGKRTIITYKDKQGILNIINIE